MCLCLLIFPIKHIRSLFKVETNVKQHHSNKFSIDLIFLCVLIVESVGSRRLGFPLASVELNCSHISCVCFRHIIHNIIDLSIGVLLEYRDVLIWSVIFFSLLFTLPPTSCEYFVICWFQFYLSMQYSHSLVPENPMHTHTHTHS